MDKNTATKTATEPNELYDSLDPTARDVWDWIGSMGFKPSKDAKGRWIATSIDLPPELAITLDPVLNLSRLGAEVEKYVKANPKTNNGEVEIYDDAKGRRLPHIPLVADKQIIDAAGKAKAINEEWKDKAKERKAAYDDLKAICHSKPHLFKPDPFNTNARIYNAGGFIVRLVDSHKETVEVEIEEDANN